jgi:hypothetical protein
MKSNCAPRLILISDTHHQSPTHTTYYTLLTSPQNSAPRLHNLLIILFLAKVFAPLTLAILGAIATYVMTPHNRNTRTNTQHRPTRTNMPGPTHTIAPRELQRPDPSPASHWIRDLTDDGDVEPHPGPQTYELEGHTIKIMTINISRDALHKLPAVLVDLQINEIDIAFITEIGIGRTSQTS